MTFFKTKLNRKSTNFSLKSTKTLDQNSFKNIKVFSIFAKIKSKRYEQFLEITQKQFSMGTRENRYQNSEIVILSHVLSFFSWYTFTCNSPYLRTLEGSEQSSANFHKPPSSYSFKSLIVGATVLEISQTQHAFMKDLIMFFRYHTTKCVQCNFFWNMIN